MTINMLLRFFEYFFKYIECRFLNVEISCYSVIFHELFVYKLISVLKCLIFRLPVVGVIFHFLVCYYYTASSGTLSRRSGVMLPHKWCPAIIPCPHNDKLKCGISRWRDDGKLKISVAKFVWINTIYSIYRICNICYYRC